VEFGATRSRRDLGPNKKRFRTSSLRIFAAGFAADRIRVLCASYAAAVQGRPPAAKPPALAAAMERRWWAL